MTKTKRFFSIFLIFAILLLSVIPVYAVPTPSSIFLGYIHTPVLNTDAAKYFSYLVNNFGSNKKGSCCYVATSMLLTYYDSYVNDNFVPDAYITRSERGIYGFPYEYGMPGNFYEEDIYTTSYSGRPYTDFVNAYSSQSLHCYLIALGFSSDLDFYNSSARTSYDGSLAISADEMVSLINKYIWSLGSNVTDQFTTARLRVRTMFASNGATQSQIRAKMIEKIRAGVPVIYFGFNSSSRAMASEDLNSETGHAMVAYDYNSTTDKIYVHIGHQDLNDLNMTLEETSYTNYGGIIWLEEESLPHVHSDNFQSSTGYVCGCQM